MPASLAALPNTVRFPTADCTFSSVSEARQAILSLAIQFMAGTLSDEERAQALASFNRWCRAFDKLSRQCSTDQAWSRGLALLELHKLFLGFHMTPAGASGKGQWDDRTNEFQDMVTVAERALLPDLEDPEAKKPRFHMDLGVLPVLFSTVLKCRDPDVRQRCIALMKAKTLQEGIWPSALTAIAAEKIVQLEAQGEKPEMPQRGSCVSVLIDPRQKFGTFRQGAGLRESVYEEVLGW